MSWKALSSEEKYRSPWMRITEDKVETDSGRLLTWSVVHQSPCVMTIPWDGERFILVNQYRYTIDQRSFQFPSGVLSHGHLEDSAVRELKEEAGFTAEALERLGKIYLAFGSSTQSMDVFIAIGLKEGVSEPDPGEEGIYSCRVSYDELREMINDGRIVDGPTIAAFGYLHSQGWIQRLGIA